MNISVKKIILTGGIIALIAGCAKEVSVDTSHMSKEYFDAWMSVNYPGATPSGLGVYIIDDTPGNGPAITDNDFIIFADYTSTDMEGNVNSTTQEKLSQQLGTYSAANYYGADIIVNDRSYTETGVLEMIKGMKVGGKRTAIIPSWLYVVNDFDTEDKYIKANGGSTTIFTISIVDKAAEIVDWEIDTLKRYVAKNLNMNPADSVKFGFYSKTLVQPTDTATFPSDTNFYINYTGRLLNGHVFDTTIEDTAKVHGIYSASKTYGPMYVTMSPETKNITISANSSESGSTTIDGFSFCLSRMRPMEKVICAFYSTLGYGYSGSGSSIPKYAPLVFEIEAVETPKDELV